MSLCPNGVCLQCAHRSLSMREVDASRPEKLESLVAHVVAVKDVRLIRDKFTGQPRGFGFMEFHSVQDAARALQLLQVQHIRFRSLSRVAAVPGMSCGRLLQAEMAGIQCPMMRTDCMQQWAVLCWSHSLIWNCRMPGWQGSRAC